MTARANWRDDAACRDADPELFFPAGTAGPALRQIGEAKRICWACPAQTQCLAWALDNGITDGVWGGTTEDERRAIRSLHRRTSTSQTDDAGESYQPAEPEPAGMLPGPSASEGRKLLTKLAAGLRKALQRLLNDMTSGLREASRSRSPCRLPGAAAHPFLPVSVRRCWSLPAARTGPH